MKNRRIGLEVSLAIIHSFRTNWSWVDIDLLFAFGRLYLNLSSMVGSLCEISVNHPRVPSFGERSQLDVSQIFLQ